MKSLRVENLPLSPTPTNVDSRSFALERGPNEVTVQQADSLVDVEPLTLLDEDLQQSDRYLEKEDNATPLSVATQQYCKEVATA